MTSDYAVGELGMVRAVTRILRAITVEYYNSAARTAADQKRQFLVGFFLRADD